MKILMIIVCLFSVQMLFISCEKEPLLEAKYFHGKWQQVHEHWGLDYFETDSLFSRDTFTIEFFTDGTCLHIADNEEYTLDWFFRDLPKQIYLTEVDQLWPNNNIYNIVDMTNNSQIWEQKGETPWYKVVHRFYLTRK